jgi:tyrosyl-tRNA synthetase
MNTVDADVERYFKLFTYLELSEIEKIVKKHLVKPEDRI